MTSTGAEDLQRRLFAWGPVVLWTGVILTLSTDSFSANETSRFIGPLLDFLFRGIDPETRELANFLLRKTAHASEYAVLAILTWRALRSGQPGRELRAVVLALAFVLSVAVVDEVGQSMRPSRTGSRRDAALDCVGGAFGLACAQGLRRLELRGRAGTVAGQRGPHP
jgi:VanZ family protein